MSYQLIVRKRAEKNIAQAYSWYELQLKTLGLDYVEKIEVALQSILENPLKYQIRYKNIRCALVAKFPYGIFYIVDKERILIFAVLHFSRNPKIWKQGQ